MSLFSKEHCKSLFNPWPLRMITVQQSSLDFIDVLCRGEIISHIKIRQALKAVKIFSGNSLFQGWVQLSLNCDGNTMGADVATTVVQVAFLMRLAKEIESYYTPKCWYSKVLIISQQVLMKIIAIALPLLKKRVFECLI